MLTSKQINQKIAGIRRSTASIRKNVHVVLCNAAAHAYEHGDVTAFTRLFDATSGLNRKRITKWVHAYGFAVLQKDGSFKLNKSARKDADFANGEAVVAYLLNATPWYADEEGAEAILKELDVAKRIEGLTKQIQDAANANRRVNIDVAGVNKALSGLRDVLAAEADKATQISAAA